MSSLNQIEGIGVTYADKLAAIGLRTTEALLDKGGTPKGRDEIAAQTGISGKLVLRWVNMADLFRIKGIAEEYADLLEAAGVDTVIELAQRNPANLTAAMVAANAEKKLVRQVPVESQVTRWVEQAKTLPRKVSY